MRGFFGRKRMAAMLLCGMMVLLQGCGGAVPVPDKESPDPPGYEAPSTYVDNSDDGMHGDLHGDIVPDRDYTDDGIHGDLHGDIAPDRDYMDDGPSGAGAVADSDGAQPLSDPGDMLRFFYKLDGPECADITIQMSVDMRDATETYPVAMDLNTCVRAEIGKAGIHVCPMSVDVHVDGLHIDSEIEGWFDNGTGEALICERRFGRYTEWYPDDRDLFSGLRSFLDRLSRLGSVRGASWSGFGGSYYYILGVPVGEEDVRGYLSAFGDDWSAFELTDCEAEVRFEQETMEFSSLTVSCGMEGRGYVGHAHVFVTFDIGRAEDDDVTAPRFEEPVSRLAAPDLEAMKALFGRGFGGLAGELIDDVRGR